MNALLVALALATYGSSDREPTPLCAEPPELVERAESVRYPIVEMRENFLGSVVVEFDVSEAGTASGIEVVRSTSSLFERAATTLVADSTFSGTPESCRTSLLIEFEMKDRKWSTKISRLPR